MQRVVHHKKVADMAGDVTPENLVVAGETPEVRPLEESDDMNISKHVIYGVFAVLIGLGVLTGYFLSQGAAAGKTAGTSDTVQTETTVGSTDAKTFKDSAVGVLQKGGSDGEGTHQLIRDGGPSQTAYLISSVVDLDQFVGKKVKVWGQTIAAKKVSWLMDVGKVELSQ